MVGRRAQEDTMAADKKHVVILGAGFAGLELSTRLSESLADEVRVTLIDRSDSFYFGFSKLDVLFHGRPADGVLMHYADIVKDGVEFRRETITKIDPQSRHVETDAGSYDADILVVALGAEYDYAATPGFSEDGYEYYSMAGTERLRDVLPSVEEGNVLVAVLGEPYKCPPAPFEGAFMLHDAFTERGVRDKITIKTMGYMGAPVPVTREVSETLLAALTERGIDFLPKRTVKSLDTGNKVAVFEDGEAIPYDLFIGIPVHRVPKVVQESGLTDGGGWVPVDTKHLTTRFPDVYALGDVAAANTAKAGVFAERAAIAVADDISARIRGTGDAAPFDGTGNCFIEFGGGLVAKVEADFFSGPTPRARLSGPSKEIAEEKVRFAADHRKRWFGR
jgi:sulfide:quinone oxidoreductase